MRKNSRYSIIGLGPLRITGIHGDDDGAFLAKSINDHGRAGHEHKVGGSDVFTFREFGLLAVEVHRKRETLQIRRVSLLSLRHGYDRRYGRPCFPQGPAVRQPFFAG